MDIFLENAQKINDFDYNKMLDDLEFESRHQRILNSIKNKWKNIGNKYKEKVDEYKKQNEILYKKKNHALQKKLKEKDDLLLRNIEYKRKLKSEERKKIGNLMKQKIDNVNQNLEIYLNEQEEKRLKLERKMNNKSIIKLIIFLIVELIEERHNKFIAESQEKISKKLKKNYQNYNKSLQMYLNKKEEEEKEKEEKAKKKFEGYVNILLFI